LNHDGTLIPSVSLYLNRFAHTGENRAIMSSDNKFDQEFGNGGSASVFAVIFLLGSVIITALVLLSVIIVKCLEL
jgi:hypothetical protein